MNTLVGIGILASFGLSIWYWSQGNLHHLYFDSGAFIAGFVLLGQFFESFVQFKMTEKMADLTGLLPSKAHLVDGSSEKDVSLGELKVGQKIKVLVGERVPVDARVLADSGATFDESILTGESVPVTRVKGTEVVQGALNVGQPVLLEVIRVSTDSLYQKLVVQVKASLAERPKIQKTVDRIATVFVPFVVFLALGTGYFWYSKNPSDTFWIVTSISVLVIACPCALGIATPTAIFVGVLRAGRRGLLLKSLDSVDKVSDITMIAFDKTGTLTKGQPSVQRIKAIDNFPSSDVLQLAVSVEQDSEHPYAVGIRNRASEDRVKVLPTKDIRIAPGRGVAGRVTKDNKSFEVVVGNLVWLFENDFDSTQVPGDLTWEAEGTHETAIWVGMDRKIVGIIFLADQIRPDAAKVVGDLIDDGFEVGMITGDSEVVAKAIAKNLKLKFVHAGVLPTEKATLVKRLQQPTKKGMDYVTHYIGFVGDGVNDAPALAEAHLGIAMGSGAAISQSTADAVLLSNEISRVRELIRILKQTRNLIFQNLSLGFVYNLVAIPVAAGVLFPKFGIVLNPMIAAVAMGASSVSVLLNSLRASRS